jgi:hypothetical protein
VLAALPERIGLGHADVAARININDCLSNITFLPSLLESDGAAADLPGFVLFFFLKKSFEIMLLA